MKKKSGSGANFFILLGAAGREGEQNEKKSFFILYPPTSGWSAVRANEKKKSIVENKDITTAGSLKCLLK